MTATPPVESFADLPESHVDREISRPLPGAPRSELVLLLVALGLGVLFDAVTNGNAPGVGLTIAIWTLLAAIALLHGRFGLGLASRGRWIWLAAIAALATTFSYRSSTELLVINTWAIFIAFLLMAIRVVGRRLIQVRLTEFFQGMLELPMHGIIRACEAIGRTATDRLAWAGISTPDAPTGDSGSDAPDAASGGHGRRSREVVIGLAIALPVLIVFAVLLASADAGFADLLGNLVHWNIEAAVEHVFITGLTFIGSAMVIIAALASVPIVPHAENRSSWATSIVVWIVLGSVTLLFAAFIALQAGYFFGGAAYLADHAGLTAAEYARRGFFELLVVAALVVPLLLALRHYADSPSAHAAYRRSAPALALLTVGLIGSAMARLWIYQDRFGLTMTRINAAVILIWLALGLTWMGVRIVIDRAPQLPAFAAATGVLLILAMDVVNPAALITRTNLHHPKAGVDIAYLVGLGSDAVPSLLDRRDDLTVDDRANLDVYLLRRDDYAHGDWRNGNLSRSRADDALKHVNTEAAH
ncbi:MAG: DUF4173 domain-containing protein [Thermoleophilia bacterium]|nr:DUF4173 domain-containing protein [Thermoleophilia bacterium]